MVSSNREARRGQARPREEQQSSPTAKGTKPTSSVPAAPSRRPREAGNPTRPHQKPPHTVRATKGLGQGVCGVESGGRFGGWSCSCSEQIFWVVFSLFYPCFPGCSCLYPCSLCLPSLSTQTCMSQLWAVIKENWELIKEICWTGRGMEALAAFLREQRCGEKSQRNVDQRKPLQSLGTHRHRARPLYPGEEIHGASCRKGLLLAPFPCWSWVFCSPMPVARLQHPPLTVVSAGSCDCPCPGMGALPAGAEPLQQET